MDRLLPVALVLLPVAVPACMGVGTGPVRFAGQTNIVIWDAEREVEHSIRDARFQTDGASLGFVAPTPTRPEVEAVSADAFATLAALEPRSAQGGFGGGGFGGSMGGVVVVERKRVAGYEATVLKASDGTALVEWMRHNGYPVPRYATDWLSPYVRAGWYVTAFRVPTDGSQGATGPVRMTFQAAVPFNPYSVPAENTGIGGLSLYYVSKGDEQPRIGRKSPWVAPEWQAKLSEETVASLNASLKLGDVPVPHGSTVRFYRDPGFGRPGFDDVYFVTTTGPARSPAPTPPVFLGLSAFGFVRVGRSNAWRSRRRP